MIPTQPLTPSPVSRGAVDALYGTAHWLFQNARHQDASAVFRVMLLAAPNDERGWLGLGASHEALEQPATALSIYDSGRVMCAAPARIELARARLLLALGRDNEAADALDAAVEHASASGDEALLALVENDRRLQ